MWSSPFTFFPLAFTPVSEKLEIVSPHKLMWKLTQLDDLLLELVAEVPGLQFGIGDFAEIPQVELLVPWPAMPCEPCLQKFESSDFILGLSVLNKVFSYPPSPNASSAPSCPKLTEVCNVCGLVKTSTSEFCEEGNTDTTSRS